MGEIKNAQLLEQIMHEAFHWLEGKYETNADTIAEIIEDYDDYMSRRIQLAVCTFCLN